MSQPSIKDYFEHDNEMYAIDISGRLWRRHPHRTDPTQDLWKLESFDGYLSGWLELAGWSPLWFGIDWAAKNETEEEKADLPELPSWDEAPEWAQWRVINASGMLIYFENKPRSDSGSGTDLILSTPGRHDDILPAVFCRPAPEDWQATIERRLKPLPSWDEAPEWAEYLGINGPGHAWWFSDTPLHDNKGYFEFNVLRDTGVRYKRAAEFVRASSLNVHVQQRPFTPPWDKIASPYDVYVVRRSEFTLRPRCGAFQRQNGVYTHQVFDAWSSNEDLARAEINVHYKRPGTC